MKRSVIRLLFAAVFLLLACSPTKTTSTDDDPCAGRCGMVNGVACGSCSYGFICNTENYCVEMAYDDIPVEEWPDIDIYDPDCPSLATAPFPYYKEDGTIHFCRGCDTPTEKDPQCVRNLWDAQNKKLTKDYPQYDCYPYPCDMPNLKPMTKEEVYAYYETIAMHECDMLLIPKGWAHDGTHGAVKHFNLSEGKVGFMMDAVDINGTQGYSTDFKVFEYDVVNKNYHVVGPIYLYGLAYYKGKAFTFMTDFRKDLNNIDVIQSYVGYFGSDGTYRVVYNKPINYIAYTPVMNDRWVLANIQEVIDGPYFVKYAKIGEWKWTNLVAGQERKSDIQGDMIALHIFDEPSGIMNGYVCDLSTSPKSIGDCQLVNQEGESVYHIQFDESGAKRFAYSSIFQKSVVLVDYSQGPGKWIRSDLITEFDDTMKNAYIMAPEQFRGDLLLYREGADMGGGAFSVLACYYRLDKKKKYCMKKMDRDFVYDDGTIRYPYGDSEFEGDYFLYQKSNSTPFILRDMKCYCEKEGVCPFEG